MILLSSKKDVSKNKKAKPPIDNSAGLYEFANDQLGENRDAAFNDLAKKSTNKKASSKKKKK